MIDPAPYDASTPQSAASLAKSESKWEMVEVENGKRDQGSIPAAGQEDAEKLKSATLIPAVSADGSQLSDPDAWRQEVAKRLTNYRARRQPRAPRYPSLQLKFEPSDASDHNLFDPNAPRPRPASHGFAPATQLATNGWPADAPIVGTTSAPNLATEPTARVIPFRRSSPTPPKPLEELAEPLQLFPRILDVPEIAPPPPALGGILMDPAEEEPNPKRPGIEIPLQTSRLSQRVFAAGIDFIVIASAFSLFAYIFFRITAIIPPIKPLAETAAIVLGILWSGYQYLLLTYAGTTPGLRLARLRLSKFDGDLVDQRTRRWRALASILSALSLGLGYAWCMLDEDQLCWHDRITKTHLAPGR